MIVATEIFRIKTVMQYNQKTGVWRNIMSGFSRPLHLDMLVDMGDRRSAALQLGEAFREVHLPV